jgi:hypothetical protein
MNLQNDHNVYILGAGFSADGGLPLIPNFLTRMQERASSVFRQEHFSSGKAIFVGSTAETYCRSMDPPAGIGRPISPELNFQIFS